MDAECSGGHRFFVAETIGVPAEGKAVILVVCTACGESFSRDFKVSAGTYPLTIPNKVEKEL